MLSEIVLLTGATGFIGSKLVERLSQKYTIVALDRPGPPEPPAPAEVVDFDLTSEEQVNAALEEVRSRFGNRIASVIHLAAYYDISGEPNPLYEKVTVEGTRRLINGLQSFEVAQFVFASTMLVHKAKQRPGLLIDENSPIDPGWAYPQSKVRAEALLHDLRDNIPVVYLRIAGVYDDIGHSPFVAEQIARIYEHRLVAHFYPGMLCAGQSFVHVEDLADAVSHVVERRTELPAELPILVGEPDVLGYEEAQDIIGEGLHGQDWRTLRIPNPLAKVGAWAQTKLLGDEDFIRPWMVEQANAHYALDVSRARDLLSWQPKHNLRETLPRMTAALQRDPLKWYEANGLNSSLVAWDCPDPVVVEEAANRSAQSHPHQAAEQAEAEDEQAAEGGQGSMTDHGQMAMMEADERRTRWAHYANIGLGLWLAASPLIYDSVTTETVGAAVRAVTEDRGLPSVEWRAGILMASDVISGLLIAIFGALSIWKRTAWCRFALNPENWSQQFQRDSSALNLRIST